MPPGVQEGRVCLEGAREMGYLEVPDTPDRKVREDTPVFLVCPPCLLDQGTRRRATLEIPELADYQASQDPEVTKVCQARLVVRVCLDFLVSPSRVKASRGSLVTPGNQEAQATPGRREKLESWDSLACLDQGVMTVRLVSLAALETLVCLELKVQEEIPTHILVLQEVKACQETQASQVDAVLTVPPETTAIQEVQVSPGRRELLVKQEDLG